MEEVSFLGLAVGSWEEWFGAVGTIAAVVVSLYLANKRPRPDLDVTFNEFVSVVAGNQLRQLMSWDIKNYSSIPTKIVSIGAVVSEAEVVNTKAKLKQFWLLMPREIFRTHKIPVDIPAHGVDTILFEFEGFQLELEQKSEFKSIVFFCQDNFGKYYYSGNFQTSSLLKKMQERTRLNNLPSA